MVLGVLGLPVHDARDALAAGERDRVERVTPTVASLASVPVAVVRVLLSARGDEPARDVGPAVVRVTVGVEVTDPDLLDLSVVRGRGGVRSATHEGDPCHEADDEGGEDVSHVVLSVHLVELVRVMAWSMA